MACYNLDIWIALSLIASEVLSFCSFVQANGILHKMLLGVSTVFEVIRSWLQKDHQQDTLTPQPDLLQDEKTRIPLDLYADDPCILHLHHGKTPCNQTILHPSTVAKYYPESRHHPMV
jgi:hypothetical protein